MSRPGPGRLTLGRWARDRGRTTPDRVAIDTPHGRTTYRELDERSERLAATLLTRGSAAVSRVATLTANSAEHVEVLFACAKAGAILLPLSWRLAPAELAYQIDDAEPVLLLVQPEHAQLADETLRLATTRPTRVELTRGALDAFAGGAGGGAAAAVADDDPLFLLYTSGTTGRPKGALLTHANCFWTNLSFDRISDVTTTDVVLQVLPQFHCGGWNVQPLLALWKGATIVLEPVFDAARALALVEAKRVTTMMGVPATYLFMSEEPGFATADLTSLRQAVVGGAPMPERLLATWQQRGVGIIQGYGLTEAAPNVLCLPPEDAARKLGYAGKPYPHVDVALRDPDTGAHLDGPAVGELVVRGPNVFPGYWRDEEATARAFADGWLLTGDVAERDEEGHYRIRDRVKDMYISGGENVYPAEVESVIHELDHVVEAAVVGVADERWGEAGLAVVAPRPGATLTEAEVIAHCRERLARFKVPREVRFVAALPRSAMNKVLKTELLERFGGELRASGSPAGRRST